MGSCIGGIFSALGNLTSSFQAEAARECARLKEEEEERRWKELFERLDGLEQGQRRLEAKVDRLESKVDRLEAKLDRVEVKLDRVEKKLDRLEAKADRQAEALAKIEAKADKIERKLDRQEKKLDTLEIKLDRLEIKADKAEKKLDKIEQKLDRQEKKLDQQEKKLDRQENKLDLQEKKLDRQEKKLDQVEKKLDRLERKLDRAAAVSWDFGDAPDGEKPSGYPRPFAQRGRFPSHRITPHGASGHGIRHRVVEGAGDRLGDGRDGESEAATIDRDRDDLPGAPGPLVSDRQGSFQVVVHADPALQTPRYLNLLCDRNRDGDWRDPGEWRVVNREVNRDAAGGFLAVETVNLKVAPNGSLDSGIYWLRLSLTREPIAGDHWDGSGPEAGFSDGETEDFLLEAR